MSDQRTNEPIEMALPALLAERGMSLRGLERELGMSTGHLSRALRGRDYKTVGGELAERIALALGLPAGYFAEAREARVIAQVRSDPTLRDRLYDRDLAARLTR